MNNRTVPIATVVEESSNQGCQSLLVLGWLVGLSLVVWIVFGQPYWKRSSSGYRRSRWYRFDCAEGTRDGLLHLTDAFGSDTRGKTRQTVKSFISRFIDEMDDSNMSRALELLACYIFNLRDSVEREKRFGILGNVWACSRTKTFSFSSTFLEEH